MKNLLKKTEDNKEPFFSIEVSKSQNIYGICEYDKKYILLDSYKDGIYIIDIESKQKVAVSYPRLYSQGYSKGLNIYSDRKAGNGILYKKIIKLKDGQVLVEGCITDIREQKMEELFRAILFRNFVVSGDYVVFLIDYISVCQLYSK